MKTDLTENLDFYYSKEGFVVFTEHYHRERGYCCGSGCRHCPFNYANVPEPKKSKLKAMKA